MRTLIAIPCMDMVHTAFFRSIISLQRTGEVQFGLSCSSLVYDSRNTLTRRAITERFDRILWFDSDMDFQPDIMQKLSARLDEGLDFCAGLAVPFYDYPKDSLFEIEGAGFGGVMMSTKLAQAVVDKYGLPFSPILGFGEDLSFCLRARELGFKLWCDSSIKCGHAGTAIYSEDSWRKLQGITDEKKGAIRWTCSSCSAA